MSVLVQWYQCVRHLSDDDLGSVRLWPEDRYYTSICVPCTAANLTALLDIGVGETA